MTQTLELTYPEDLSKPHNFGILIRHCLEMIPDEAWRIIECKGRTLTLECDSIRITATANDTTDDAENEQTGNLSIPGRHGHQARRHG